MRRLWLLFAQSVTITLGVWFVAALLRPDLMPAPLQPWRSLPEAQAPRPAGAPVAATAAPPPALPATGTWSDAAARAMPSVVNIYTTARVSPRERNSALEDPFFQFFFGDRMPGGRGRGEAEPRQRPASLGSGTWPSSRPTWAACRRSPSATRRRYAWATRCWRSAIRSASDKR